MHVYGVSLLYTEHIFLKLLIRDSRENNWVPMPEFSMEIAPFLIRIFSVHFR